MLTAKDLWFRYDRRRPWIVQDISLSIAPGEIVGLCGPSGSGKSTIGRLLAGLLTPDRGEIHLDSDCGEDFVDPDRPVPHPVQLVLQHPERAMNPQWRVRDILAESGAAAADIAAVDPELVRPEWLGRFPHEISGGELQRVNLARALLTRPGYIVADEISASLDPITQARIWHLLLDRAETDTIGVLAISHDQDLLAAVTDRLILIP